MVADYIIVGGGTAGAVLAHRLSEDPHISVLVIEAGPSDEHEVRAHSIRSWEEMIYSEYDADFRCVSAGRGNPYIRQSRMHILGGCSTANTMIMWRPLAADLRKWEKYGVSGWPVEKLSQAYDKLLTKISPVAPQDQNNIVSGVIESARQALDLPQYTHWNSSDFLQTGEGVGFFEVGYDPATNRRSSSSITYLHDIMHHRSNLTMAFCTQVKRIILEENQAIGVEILDSTGKTDFIRVKREVILSAGAIESPVVLMRSGIGPAEILASAKIPLVVDLAGVGENLMDHAEGIVIWEIDRAIPQTCASGWDAGAAIRLETDAEFDNYSSSPDILMHFPVQAYVEQVERLGIHFPENIISIAANISNPASRGKVWITSADPTEPPCIDYGYFTDIASEDEKKLVAAIRLARKIALSQPLAKWIVREIFPGPECTTDIEISELERKIHQTVYHVSGTCRMGADDDPLAVLDSELRVRNTTGLRVVDASIFPTIPAVNPVGLVLACAEYAAEIIKSTESSRKHT